MKPAITSEQWFRYSETRLRPVRKAVQRVPKHSTGLASRLLFVLIVLVMYICSGRETNESWTVLVLGPPQECAHVSQVRNRDFVKGNLSNKISLDNFIKLVC